MRISNLRLSHRDGWRFLLGNVSWESSEKESVDLYFAVPEGHAQHLQLAPEALVAACFVPAVFSNEERIEVDGQLCPLFRDGILTNLDYLHRWYGASTRFELVSSRGPNPPNADQGKVGMLLSGGVDSQFTLYRWHKLLPEGHPDHIRHCFNIDYDHYRRSDPANQRPISDAYFSMLERHLELLGAAAQSLGADLCPVRTNVNALNDDGGFWINAFHGAAMAGLSHAVGSKLRAMRFASGDIPLMKAYGSHPLTDPNWSNRELQILHDTMRYSRYEKTGSIANWAAGRPALRVCVSRTSDRINCGACEKCLRTMLMLLCLGKAPHPAFPASDVTVADLSRVRFHSLYEARQYNALLPHLERIQRADLVTDIRSKLEDFKRSDRS